MIIGYRHDKATNINGPPDAPIYNINELFGGCSTNVSRALQNILSKFVFFRNSTCDENVKLKICMCAKSHALGTHTKFQLEILNINVISGVMYFCEIILESSRNVSETTPCLLTVNSIYLDNWGPSTSQLLQLLFYIIYGFLNPLGLLLYWTQWNRVIKQVISTKNSQKAWLTHGAYSPFHWLEILSWQPKFCRQHIKMYQLCSKLLIILNVANAAEPFTC